MDHDKDKDKSNPIIVFDTNETDGQSNISIGYRQPSFIRLKGVLIPKGFDSLDEFQTCHVRVKVNSVRDISATTQTIQELLTKRNEQKWKEMGYDPMQIENSLNRQHSHTLFTNKENKNNLKDIKIFSSFSQLESFDLDSKPSNTDSKYQLMDITEEAEEEEPKKPIFRSLSSGLQFPNLELPESNSSVSSPEEEEDSDSYSDQTYVCFLDNGMPEHVYNILKHDPNTLVYKVLCGRTFPGLPYDIMNILTDELEYYATECADESHEATAYHVQSLIEELRRTADRSDLYVPPSNQATYQKKIKEFYNSFEAKVEYWDTQLFLNKDFQERSIKKLNENPKIKKQSKEYEDQLQFIQFQYDKALFAINRGQTENLQRLKECIEKVQNGYTQVSMDLQVLHLSSRIMSRNRRITACSKVNKMRISTNSNPKIIRPQTPTYAFKLPRN